MKRFFVTGIGTDVGKTIVSAIITEALNADYWKPIQAGDLTNSDSIKVKSLITNTKSIIHPEQFCLSQASSPHAAAKADKVDMQLRDFRIPQTSNILVIEGAGGLMVPFNDEHLIIDLIEKWDAEVILVSKNYLGSINHTLLSVEALQSRDISIAGIVFNGNPVPSTEEYILNYTGLKRLFSVNEEPIIDPKTIMNYAAKLKLEQ